jgi:RNA polymerase sigma-70 factor (sigma-E family)
MTDRDLQFTAAFAELYARALRVARRIVGDPAAAEDVAAEALARAYDRWEEIDVPLAWTVRIAANLAIDATRRRELPAERVERNGTADPTDTVALRLALVAALRELPERQRQVVVLRYLAGVPQAEVARALGVSPGTVAQHVHRGAAALRAALVDTPEEEPMRQPFALSVGDRRSGRVCAVVPFGAFVEIEGRHGLLHRDEYRSEGAPAVGEHLDVVVLAVDDERERFSLRQVA